MNVTVYCGSSAGSNPHFSRCAREVGEWIAAQGHTLVYGGSAVGLMGTVSRAVLDGGGQAIGVEPGFFIDAGVAQHDLTELHVVDTMAERKAKMIELGDAFVALPGGVGTLEEIAEITSRIRLGLGPDECFLLNIDGYYDPLKQLLERMVECGFLAQDDLECIHFPGSVAALAEALARDVEPPETRRITTPEFSAPIPLVGVELMRASDAHTIETLVDDVELMDRAGRGIAALCCDFPGPYAILCGPGNNGGDGYVVARYLAAHSEADRAAAPQTTASAPRMATAEAAETTGPDAAGTAAPDTTHAVPSSKCTGNPARVSVFFTKEAASESARHHRALLEGTDVDVRPFTPDCDLSAFGTVVDCLLGTGFDGRPRGLVADAIAAINDAGRSGAHIVSADINSGVNGDTGHGEVAVKSDLTVSIGFLKTGMVAEEMGRWTRRVINIDIGIELADAPTATAAPADLPAWIDPILAK